MRRWIVRWLPALALVAAPGLLAAQGGAPDAAAVAGPRWELLLVPQLIASFDAGMSRPIGADLKGFGATVEFVHVSGFATYATARHASVAISCADVADVRCPDEGWGLVAGVNARRRASSGPVTPYVGAGAGVFRWEDGSRDVSGEAHIGVDLRSGRLGVRLEARLGPHARPGLVAGVVLVAGSH